MEEAAVRDRDSDLCFVCRLPGECEHRERELVSVRRRETLLHCDRRKAYVTEPGREVVIPPESPPTPQIASVRDSPAQGAILRAAGGKGYNLSVTPDDAYASRRS